jgi:hypothetical protein
VTTAEDTAVSLALMASDVDGDGLNYSVVSGPAHGTLSGSGPNLIYSPALNYNGADSFTFKVNDGALNSAVATVSIAVTAMNDAPVASPQSISTSYNAAVNIALSGSDVDGDALIYTIVSGPSHGTLAGTAPNLTYTPAVSYVGADSFTFKVSDGSLESATVSVSISVQAPASVPAAPGGLTATAFSKSQINLAWIDNATNEDGFKIERSTDNKNWTQIATVGMDARSYSSTGLSANKTYYHRVRAYNPLGNSAYSNVASAKTLQQ